MTDDVINDKVDDTTPTPKVAEPKKRKGFHQGSVVTEPGTVGQYPGSVSLPTYSRNELNAWLAKLTDSIEAAQPDRVLRINKGDVKGLNTWPISETAEIYVTDKEAEILLAIRTSLKGLYQGHDECEFLNPSDEISNLPTYATGGKEIPIAIMSVNSDKISDPVMRVKSKLGLSVPRNIPLWNSGFRLEIEGPSTLESLNLETKLIMEKIDVSYDTFGYALTSANIWMDRILIEFFLDRATKSTAGTVDYETLLRLISLTDLDTLTLGVASAIFPDGYTLERDLLKEVDGELTTTKVKSKVNPWRMLGVKTNCFTAAEKQRLAKTAGTTDHKTLKEHRKGLRAEVSRYVDIDDTFMIKLCVPTLEEYLRIGLTWHTYMEDRVNKVLASSGGEDERKVLLARSSEVARVMFLAHWVEGIYEKPDESSAEPIPLEGFVRLDSDEHSIEDVNATDKRIEEILEELSTSPTKCDAILDGIEAFSKKMRTTSVVIPRDPGAPAPKGEHPHVVTINPAELFFTLLRHKILMAGG